MKVVLFAGGLGSRLSEETVRVPKPMVEVHGKPIILHVMDIYSRWNVTDFIVACGYKCMMMKSFFNDLHLLANDFTVKIDDGRVALKSMRTMNWNVSVVDTGEATMTGGRLRRLREWIGQETFMATYSDGLGNIDIPALLAFHRAHGGLATVTAVQPPARFGNLDIEGGRVVDFTEKVNRSDTWINGGFFVLEPEVLDYVERDDEPFEQGPLMRLTRDGQLFAFQHSGFWHPMDTLRDRDHLNACAAAGSPPWLDFGPLSRPEAAPEPVRLHA